MGDVEVCMNTEGALKVQHDIPRNVVFSRFRFSPWWSNGRQQRLVARRLNCSRYWPNWQDVSPDPVRFQVLFILILILCVIRIFYELSLTQTMGKPGALLLYMLDQGRTFVFLLVFTAVFVVRLLMKIEKRMTASSPPWKVEVKTVSGLIQHV